MASNTTLLCRLCLETRANFVNIFDKFHNPPFSSVLSQHFWFQVYKNDGFSEWLCLSCWKNTETFHRFYKRIESLQTGHWNSIKLVEKEDGIPDKTVSIEANYNSSDRIKQERSDSSKEVALEPVFKYEETETEPEMIDLALVKEENTDDKCCDQSKHSSTPDETNGVKIAKINKILSRTKNVKEKGKISRAKMIKESIETNRSLKDKQMAQIREFFDMKCDICSDVTFETLGKALKHYRTVHKTSGYITCCGKKHHYRATIMDHIKFHLNPNAFCCTPCNKRFKDRRALKRHIGVHELPTTHNCSFCSKKYMSAGALLEHERNKHSAEEDKTFQCDICQKFFFTKIAVKLHIRRDHLLAYAQDQICEICARVFKSKQGLRYHMQESHSTTVQPKVQCNVCGAWLKHERFLRKHLQRHRDDFAKCSICNKVLQNKDSLQRHIKLVHGEWHHRCSICHRAFATAKRLKEHMAGHTGEELYKCSYCDKTFKSNANMYSHRKKVHLSEWTLEFRNPKKLEKISTR